jgi:hypothetical protein
MDHQVSAGRTRVIRHESALGYYARDLDGFLWGFSTYTPPT